MQTKSSRRIFQTCARIAEKLLRGKFPDIIREQFVQMLEHYGQSPIIVRSSSLLEDNFGNAFAGKYESIFCANQGTPEARLEAFENAVRTVYASTMGDDALAYRKNRGLAGRDEQMAILVQRVSGDHYGDLFFPHTAGVGNSTNLYMWDKNMNPNAGMLRLVFGLGTRAVDRVSGDYAKIVPLDNPRKAPPVKYGDEMKFSQRNADVLNLRENRLAEVRLDSLSDVDLKTDKNLFSSVNHTEASRLRELGVKYSSPPRIFDFNGLLTGTEFPRYMTAILDALKSAYNYPVDIEFAVNANPESDFRINILQCRPLQTKGVGAAVTIPEADEKDVFIMSEGNFMGGNVRLPINYTVFVNAKEYLELSEQNKYQTARMIGTINKKLKEENVLLVGPGRWGTTTPSLGVPVHFSELSNMAALCEVSDKQGGFMPELSFGSHFFQDIVEAGIFYAAIFDGTEKVTFRPEKILERENLLKKLLSVEKKWEQVIHISNTPGLTLYSDIVSQRLLCFGLE